MLFAAAAVVALLAVSADASRAILSEGGEGEGGRGACLDGQEEWPWGSGHWGCKCVDPHHFMGPYGRCLECPSVSYCDQGRNQCVPCPAGQHYDGDSRKCKACGYGEEWDEGSKRCKAPEHEGCDDDEIEVTGGCWKCEGGSHPSADKKYCACKWGRYDYNEKSCSCPDDCIYVMSDCYKCEGEGAHKKRDGNSCECEDKSEYDYNNHRCKGHEEGDEGHDQGHDEEHDD